ncbi:cohesin domain-containing protein [Patescibacteria group bacterium]|nr:cohesin domain-containing protein [Patescibacteria group bacterium]MBU4347130.1 cohesin domain-containing protein [Patescibacteria group bacterium]MBU4455551.1 cohesin domain-containing protein [Patescibacteria group bacterium]MCG2690541.1 cohesin domain-containing protein [Candidatus Parcubacteria bacterium]
MNNTQLKSFKDLMREFSIQNLGFREKKSPIFYILNSVFFFVALFFIFYILNPRIITAAEFNLTSQAQEISVGDQFETILFLNTEGEDINAIEGKIIFPANILELKDIKDGNSIINFWIERPRSDAAGSVIFSGITPGGFRSENGLVFSLVFEPKERNKGQIEFSGIRALKNDGLGTPADVSTQPLEFEITEADLPPEESIEIKVRDYEPPESFAPEIARDESMFGGRWFLVFATQDKGSGIDHYEILERREFRIQNLEFRGLIRKILYPISYILNPLAVAESPYLLEDQELRSYIYIKAVDKAGNERIETIFPRNPLKWYENYLIWGIIILGAVITYWMIKNLEFRI